MAALVGFAHNLEPIMLHDGHVGHVTGWHVAQSLPSRRSFPSVPPRHSRCTRPHVSCSAWAPGLTASPPFACRRSSSTSPRQPFRLLPLCGVICRLVPSLDKSHRVDLLWNFLTLINTKNRTNVCVIRKIVFTLPRLVLPRQKLKTPIEPSQQARFIFFYKKNENSYRKIWQIRIFVLPLHCLKRSLTLLNHFNYV